MIDTLVIVVYNRFENLVKWFDNLEQCSRPKNVAVIHNIDGIHDQYSKLCEENNAIYIRRQNIGFDIGAFQDVCMHRLPGFPEWNQLLWCCDDTFPMQSNFIDFFGLNPGEGVRCMEISNYVKPHIRTTGFSIAKTTAQRLKFPANPVLTKQHCYLFEHRDPKNTFMQQIQRMGLTVKMVAPKEISPMFDVGYHRREKRDNELFGIAPVPPKPLAKVTIICPIFKTFPAIISSLIMQTYKDWKLILIHDGPSDGSVKAFVELINDDRIEYIETENHAGNWGHSIRAEWLQKVETECVIITNPDNFYTPVFLEYAINELSKNGAVAVYSSQIVHSYTNWKVMQCSVKRGFIDCGQVLLKTKEAQVVGWNNITDHSADWFFFNDIAKRYGVNRFKPFPGCHFIHN